MEKVLGNALPRVFVCWAPLEAKGLRRTFNSVSPVVRDFHASFTRILYLSRALRQDLNGMRISIEIRLV